MPDHQPLPLSFLAWGVGRRLAVAVCALIPLWAAVGWALGWWGA